jgi:hypothetical protein
MVFPMRAPCAVLVLVAIRPLPSGAVHDWLTVGRTFDGGDCPLLAAGRRHHRRLT